MSTDNFKLDTCGCCGAPPAKPVIENRPGLPALSYRLGTHGDFFARMVADLPTQSVPDNAGARPLAPLSTRSTGDPAIALLDAWATVADVLAFYQERIANEGYLRTATERLSVLELAREIGYELKPGVAASADIAFTVESAATAPASAAVFTGTKVLSVPVQGKQPQTFETIETIQARVEWNSLRPQMYQKQPLTTDGVTYYFEGTNLNLRSGDLLLIVDASKKTQPRRIKTVSVQNSLQRTAVDLEPVGPPPPPPPPPIFVYAVPTLQFYSFSQANIVNQVSSFNWHETDLSAMIRIQGWRGVDIVATTPRLRPEPPLPDAQIGVFAFRARDGVFGNNAPNYNNLTDSVQGKNIAWSDTFEIWKDQRRTGTPYYSDDATLDYRVDLYLERSEPGILANTWTVLERPGGAFLTLRVDSVAQGSLSAFAISGKATGLRLAKVDGTPIANSDKPGAFHIGNTTVYAQSEPLTLSLLPIDDPVPAGSTSLTIDPIVLGLAVGQRVALRGELADAPGVNRAEIAVLRDVVHGGGYTTLAFKDPIQNSYTRKSLTVSANLARATHGETVVKEVLGSGDGSKANQKFTLKKPPLTYVSAQGASGSQSTLTIRVNGVEWHEAPSLYGLDPRSQSYIVELEDDGTTIITFGDGISGARLPTGSENVIATYRTGIGPDGEVDQDSLTLLISPPLGIRSATNPVAAGGAAAPEQLDEARGNAPRTVLTFDRVVSLQDYEDFARGFSGIGKARAVALFRREESRIHITVGAADGSKLDPSSATLINLIGALAVAHDFTAMIDVQSYQAQYFNVQARLVIDPDYIAADVLSAADAALKAAFSFDQRAFGQGVHASEIVFALQNVPGVIASELDKVYLVTDPNGPAQTAPPEFLPAASATWNDAGIIYPSQLLTINPVGVALSETKA
jgi:hypothetical protein